jgi:hypothetical protein
MSLYLKLLLGPPIPSLMESSPVCPSRQNHDFHGYHRLNCKQNAGRANRAAHDLVQLALKKEFQRLGLRVVDNDNEMRKQYAHLSSQKRGDLAILSASNFLICDSNIVFYLLSSRNSMIIIGINRAINKLVSCASYSHILCCTRKA